MSKLPLSRDEIAEVFKDAWCAEVVRLFGVAAVNAVLDGVQPAATGLIKAVVHSLELLEAATDALPDL